MGTLSTQRLQPILDVANPAARRKPGCPDPCAKHESQDGRSLLYLEYDPKTRADLWALEVNRKERKPRVVVKTPFDEYSGQFSPDGLWVAYL